MCELWKAVGFALNAYFIILLAYALVSWIPSLRGPWSDVVARLVEPVLLPVRRVIPPIAGFDIAFLVVLFVIQAVNNAIVHQNMVSACFLGM
jgi:YggT family protein